MHNIQRRILGFNKMARRLLYLTVAAGFLAVVCVVAQSYILSMAVDAVFLQRQTLAQVLPLLAVLLALAIVRGALVWGGDVLAQRAAGTLKGSLRAALARRLFELGPAYTRRHSSGELAYVAVEGVQTLDEYITLYQPVRLLARLAPLFVFLVILAIDPLTTLVLLFTGPILLLLLALLGSRTKEITEKRYRELSLLSAFFLDVLQGLATLKLFGRSREQVENIRRISSSYGATTMEVLQTAFQTGFVLEFGGTVATAVVAVEVSLRLMAGMLPFDQALAVLVITPEFFLPLRQYALRYHAGAAGKAAGESIFAILDAPLPPRPTAAAARGVPERLDIRFDDVHYAYEAGGRPALKGLSLHIEQGTTVAMVGATGSGKTTVANLLLRFIDISDGGAEPSPRSSPRSRACPAPSGIGRRGEGRVRGDAAIREASPSEPGPLYRPPQPSPQEGEEQAVV